MLGCQAPHTASSSEHRKEISFTCGLFWLWWKAPFSCGVPQWLQALITGCRVAAQTCVAERTPKPAASQQPWSRRYPNGTHIYIYKPTALEPLLYRWCTCVYTYIHTYIQTYTHTYIRTCIHTDIHTYLHTDIDTYIHTYTYTYTHTYM